MNTRGTAVHWLRSVRPWIGLIMFLGVSARNQSSVLSLASTAFPDTNVTVLRFLHVTTAASVLFHLMLVVAVATLLNTAMHLSGLDTGVSRSGLLRLVADAHWPLVVWAVFVLCIIASVPNPDARQYSDVIRIAAVSRPAAYAASVVWLVSDIRAQFLFSRIEACGVVVVPVSLLGALLWLVNAAMSAVGHS